MWFLRRAPRPEPSVQRKPARAQVRAATPDAFRAEIPEATLANATAAMAPLLHPALRMKWLCNAHEIDSEVLGLPGCREGNLL